MAPQATSTGREDLKFYTSPTIPFSGYSRPLEEAEYVVVGVPYDGTSTYRAGSRFGPSAIREASANIETYSLRTGVDIEDVKIHDAGNLDVSQNLPETLKRLRFVTSEIVTSGKTPVIIGGEHTITYGSVHGLGKEVAIISFDAHLDLRDEYLGERLSHTTFMRRIAEKFKPKSLVITGVRAVSKGELTFADSRKVNYVPVSRVRQIGPQKTAELLRSLTSKSKYLYVTIDLDVLDPAYAPAVGNPESDGLTPDALLTILDGICDSRVIGFDLVEVAPHYDRGETAVAAARTLFEVISSIEASRKKR